MDKIQDLPTAIRIGCQMIPKQCKGWVEWNRSYEGVFMLMATCALGAAGTATHPGGALGFHYGDRYGWLARRFNAPPGLVSYVINCNDKRGLTREQIAAILHAREWAEYKTNDLSCVGICGGSRPTRLYS